MGDAISLGDAVKKFLETSRIKQQIQSLSVEDHWEKLMGKTISNYTDRIEIKNKTLFIYTAVAPLKNELVFQKELIKERVNEVMGADTINEVVIA